GGCLPQPAHAGRPRAAVTEPHSPSRGQGRAGQQDGAGAVPGPALAALPLHLHLRPQQQHPLRVQAGGALQRWAGDGAGAGCSVPGAAAQCPSLGRLRAGEEAGGRERRGAAPCSTAILLYLSRKYNTPDHWYPSDVQKRAQVDEYLSWHHANIRANAPKTMWIKVLIPLFTGQPLPSEKLQEVMEGLFASLKQFEERFLQDKAFIIGSEISLADLVAIVELMQPVGVGCDIFEDRPRLTEWRRRVEDAVGKELFFQAHEMIFNIKELSNIQIHPQLKEHLAPVLMKMLK
uniref:glutathione transferase n=1 Tax=Strigops habroptila TaxID=2489341 RepID=A0A672UTI3_STRHB